jgi:hypothetical protein
MTTELNRVVRRKFESRTLRYPIILQVEPGGILKLREKGMRRWYSISLEELYKRLVVAEARAERLAKKALRKRRR